VSRYALTSLGPAEKLGAAQIPIRAQMAQAYQSRGMIDGSPGTTQIPAPRPAGMPQDTTGLAQSHFHRSSDSPNLWYPGVYYQANATDPPEHAPVSVLSDNQMPMPALSPLGLPSVSQGRPRLGGQYQVANRASVPAYPSLGGSSG